MKDRIVEHPNRYSLEPVDAAEGVVDLIPFPGYVTEPGTPLNKGTLLSDETAAALGLAGDPTVDEALNAIGGALALGVQIATGSYVGTGTFGESNPNVLTFDFEPYAVFVFQDSYVPVRVSSSLVVYSNTFVCFLKGGASVKVASGTRIPGIGGNPSYVSDTTAEMPYTISGKTISWYNTGSNENNLGPTSQMNISGTTYHYMAIGRGSAA